MEEELQAGAQEPAPPHTGPSLTSSNPRPTLLHVDWLASDPAGLRYAAINAGIWPQIGAQVGLDSSLPALLGALRTYFEQCKAAGIVPVVVIGARRHMLGLPLLHAGHEVCSCSLLINVDTLLLPHTQCRVCCPPRAGLQTTPAR